MNNKLEDKDTAYLLKELPDNIEYRSPQESLALRRKVFELTTTSSDVIVRTGLMPLGQQIINKD